MRRMRRSGCCRCRDRISCCLTTSSSSSTPRRTSARSATHGRASTPHMAGPRGTRSRGGAIERTRSRACGRCGAVVKTRGASTMCGLWTQISHLLHASTLAG
eukprot:4474950-Prymnesium_polylepis.1